VIIKFTFYFSKCESRISSRLEYQLGLC